MCFLKSGRAPRKSRGCVCVISRFLPQRHGNYPIRRSFGENRRLTITDLLAVRQALALFEHKSNQHFVNDSQRFFTLVWARPSPHEPFFKQTCFTLFLCFYECLLDLWCLKCYTKHPPPWKNCLFIQLFGTGRLPPILLISLPFFYSVLSLQPSVFSREPGNTTTQVWALL